jgi:hypothetical protein
LIGPVRLDARGRWTIIVRDFDGGGCTGDAYNLSVTGPRPLRSSLSLINDDDCVANPPEADEAAEAAKGSGE